MQGVIGNTAAERKRQGRRCNQVVIFPGVLGELVGVVPLRHDPTRYEEHVASILTRLWSRPPFECV